MCLLNYFTVNWQEKLGRGNIILVSVFVCHAGRPGSRPVQSVCFRKVKCFQNVINFSPPVPTTGSQKAVHVLSCLCDNACKRSLSICQKSRALCMCWTGTLIWYKQSNKQTEKQNKRSGVMYYIYQKVLKAQGRYPPEKIIINNIKRALLIRLPFNATSIRNWTTLFSGPHASIAG